MSRLLGAAACVFLTLGSAAAERKPKPQPTRLSGTVVKSEAGRLTMTDKHDRIEELKASPRTKITLDGKPAQLKAAQPGTAIVSAVYDPNTRVLAALELKSGPRPPEAAVEPAPGVVNGEIANTDVMRGALSLRLGPQNMREFTVTEQTAIKDVEGRPASFEALKIGDAVEVSSKDGKSAAEVRVRAAP